MEMNNKKLISIRNTQISYGRNGELRLKGIHRLRPNFEIGSLVGRNL